MKKNNIFFIVIEIIIIAHICLKILGGIGKPTDYIYLFFAVVVGILEIVRCVQNKQKRKEDI